MVEIISPVMKVAAKARIRIVFVIEC